jgi:hypothetical protein
LPISATDSITLAFRHTKRQLFEPFRFWQWTRLALVGLLAGEMSGGGGNFSFPGNFNVPSQTGSSRHFLNSGLDSIDPALLGAMITVLVVADLTFGLVLMYISSVMRFILFDSVLLKECRIRQGWSRRQGPGWKYFLWQLGFTLATLVALAVLLGIPAGFAYTMGWFDAPREHILGLIAGGIVLFAVLLVLFVAIAVIHVLTKDFVVPQMALEGIGAIEGWRRLWLMLQAEKGGYAAYVGMKIVLAIGAGIVIGILSLVLVFLFALPAAALGIIAVISGESAGLTWNVVTITIAVVVGLVLLMLFMYLLALISVPAIVFFPAYSIYYFAPRYRALSLMLYPPRPPASPPAGGGPPEPPPLMPFPEPIG